MVRGIADQSGQFVEPQRFRRRLDQRDGARHGDPVAPDLIGRAAQTRAKSRVARFLGRAIEHDILALRVARRAARLAIDAGGFHRADEAAIAVPIARFERAPGGIGIERERKRLRHATAIRASARASHPTACAQSGRDLSPAAAPARAHRRARRSSAWRGSPPHSPPRHRRARRRCTASPPPHSRHAVRHTRRD